MLEFDPGPRSMHWPAALEIADAALLRDVRQANATTAAGSTAVDAMAAALNDFLTLRRDLDVVLVRTSTTGNRSADHEVSPALLSTILSTIRDVQANVRIQIGDGPAYSGYAAECERLGYRDVADRFGAEIIDLNTDVYVFRGQWPIAQSFLSASAVLNLTRAKTHRRFGVSLSGKSLLGVLSGVVLGFPKFPNSHRDVPQLMQHLEKLAPSHFNVIEGNPGIEGEGPMNGASAASDFVVYGDSFRACDVLACVEMGFDPVLVPALIRPIRPITESDSMTVDWAALRRSDYNYLPARTCSWLYRSLDRPRERPRTFATLMEGIRSCWTNDNGAV